MIFDEKSLVILEKLNKTPTSLHMETLYEATKPTQYRGLLRRVGELKEAGLINTTNATYCKITDFGRQVASMLSEE